MYEQIKELRKHLSMTQKEFGESLGISRDVMANIENNRVEPSESLVRLICATYKVSYIWLTQGVGDMFQAVDDDLTTMIDSILMGENETAKAIFRAFAKLEDEDWLVIKKIIDEIKK